MIRSASVLAGCFLLVACSSDEAPGDRFMGTWSYLQGSGRYQCDDGQAGTVQVRAGSSVEFFRDGERILRRDAECTLEVALADDGMTSVPSSSCSYDKVDPTFGRYTTVERFAPEGTAWTVDDADTLHEQSHRIFDVTYEQGGFHFVCDVVLSAEAVRD